MKAVLFITYILMFVGALNWGLIGLYNFDLVAGIFGPMSTLSRTVYSLVGISAAINLLLLIATSKPVAKCCHLHQ